MNLIFSTKASKAYSLYVNKNSHKKYIYCFQSKKKIHILFASSIRQEIPYNWKRNKYSENSYFKLHHSYGTNTNTRVFLLRFDHAIYLKRYLFSSINEMINNNFIKRLFDPLTTTSFRRKRVFELENFVSKRLI